MNKYFIKIFLIISILSWQSCEKKEPFVFKYETNPTYTWGYGEFLGAFYKHYDIDNHLLSLSLFTDSLFLDEDNALNGFGVYLNIDDIFIPETDTIFPPGTYVVSLPVDSINPVEGKKFGDLMTISCGEQFDKYGAKYDFGTYVYFIEKLENYTTRKFVVDGSMSISYPGDKIQFDFDFILHDETILQGKYIVLQKEFVFFDDSVSPKLDENDRQMSPRKPILKNK